MTNSKLPTSASSNPAARVQTYVRRGGRRKWVSALLLGGTVLGVLAVIRAYRRGSRFGVPPESVQPVPENARQWAAGYSLTRNEHDHPVFTIRAQRSLDLRDGEGTLLEGVQVEIFGRAGDQHDLFQTQRCEYKPDSGDFYCAGKVMMELAAPPGSTVPQTADAAAAGGTLGGRRPVYLQTSALSYNQQKSLATTAAPVQWRYGDASGSAVGMVYSPRDGRLELERDVSASLPVASVDSARGTPDADRMIVKAANLRYFKGQVELAGPLDISQGGRDVTAAHAVAYLDAQNRITRAALDQGVRASDPSTNSLLTAQANAMQAEFEPATGNLEDIDASGSVSIDSRATAGSAITHLQADRVQTKFAGAHFHPVGGTATGNVHLNSNAVRQNKGTPQGSAGSGLSSESLDAGRIDFTFRPADGSLAEAHTIGPAKLLLVPATSKAGKRDVTAGQFEVAFDARSRLESVHGSAPTRIVFEPAPAAKPGTLPSVTEAQDLQAMLDPVSGSVQTIKQSGQFQFRHADEQASSDRAEFSGDAGTLALLGAPQVSDPETKIEADRVVLHLGTNTAEGTGHVKSTRFGTIPSGGGPHATAKASSDSRETHVLAERVTADRALGVLHYEGHVKAWRGTDVVESPTLDLYRSERRIVAGTPVLTSDLAPASKPRPERPQATTAKGHFRSETGPESSSPAATEPVVIRADRLQYFDLEHRAAYRGHVRMDSSGATLNSDRLDAYFTDGADGSSKLDHAVADGSVTVVEPGRRAAGKHADYDAAAGRIVLTGGPPTLYDSEKGFVTGQSLTFFTEGGSLLVDGGDGYRTLSTHQSTK